MLETVQACDVKAAVASLKGDVDVDVAIDNIADKIIVDITIIGREGRLKYHGEVLESQVTHQDGIHSQQIRDATAKRICVSGRGIAIWFEGDLPVRLLFKVEANTTPSCIQSFSFDETRCLVS